jgi:F-type H+-transporting ATPase subunit delta
MRGASRESLLLGRQRVESLLDGATVDPLELAEDLFGVAMVLSGSAGLRRALTDPTRAGADKADLVRRLFGFRIGPVAVDLVSGLVHSRWAYPRDLTEAVESLGMTAVLVNAERDGRLDTVEDELFRFSRIVAGDPGLRDAFSGRAVGIDRKAELVRRLLAGRAAPETVRLAVEAACHPRGLRTEQVLQRFADAAAERREQLLALVVTAVPPTRQQQDRLVAALRRLYGRSIRLRIDVDPAVVGGARVSVTGEVLDGTVAGRIEELGRRLAG